MLIPGLVRFWAISEGWVGLAVLFVAGPFRTHMYLVTLKICISGNCIGAGFPKLRNFRTYFAACCFQEEGLSTQSSNTLPPAWAGNAISKEQAGEPVFNFLTHIES